VEEKKSKRKALGCIGIAGLLLLLCSCASFDIGDWPSMFVCPHNDPSSNLCGPIGAFCAYYLLYYTGPGVFVVLVSGICFLAVRLARRPIGQPILRATGLVLLTVAASGSFYCLWPYRVFSFPIGSGGVLGVAAILFLRSHFASLGTFILVAATWVVGIVLLADKFFLILFGWLSFGLSKIMGMAVPAWSAARQHSEVLSEIYEVGASLGGTISGEHGLGCYKKGIFPLVADKHEIDLMKRVKQAFDPNTIMNPGKIFDL